jgi:hypothetical protein
MAKDPLVDNKHFYNFNYYLLHYFGMILQISFILYVVGILNVEPIVVLIINNVIKIVLACFLIYRFNSYRKMEIRITELDKKIAFSSGVYILLVTFSDFVELFTEELRRYVLWLSAIIERFYLKNVLGSSGITASSDVSISYVADATRDTIYGEPQKNNNRIGENGQNQ